MLIFGRRFTAQHQENITWSDSSATSSGQVCTDSPWKGMYADDKYARDRVMKSARLLLPFLKDNDMILDVGCFTQEAKKYFPPWIRYIGIDEKAYHKTTQVTNLHHGFTPIPCQHALCLETLEHLLDPEDTLQSIRDSLEVDGLLVVSLPNEATLFHRIRCLFGIVDGGAFQSEGKHLHLPNLKQSKGLLGSRFEILDTKYYISPSANGSKQAWVGRILKVLPDNLHQYMADAFPSFFARGFIFLLKKKIIPDNMSSPLPMQSQPS